MRSLALALFLHAAAASAEPPSYDLSKLEEIEGPSFRPESKQYPAQLSSAGVQGKVLVVVPLTEEGKSDGAVLGQSSRSAQLDQAAVDFMKSVKFEIKVAKEKGWKAVVVPVEFYRDSVTTLHTKTCADFNTDLVYEQATFPEKKLQEMRIFEMLTGVLYIGLGAKPDQAAGIAKRAAAARQVTVNACKADPQQLFYKAWQNALKTAA